MSGSKAKTISKNIEELKSKYSFDGAMIGKNKKECKFGYVTSQMPNMNISLYGLEKSFTIKIIEPHKDYVSLFTKFVLEILSFQRMYGKECYLHKIKEVYKDEKTNVFYIVQKDYNRCLLDLCGTLNEIEILSILRKIFRFYNKLMSDSLLDYFLDPDLDIEPLKAKNITYYRFIPKKQKFFKYNRLLIDFMSFAKKNDNNKKKKDNLHLEALKKLIFRLWFERNTKEIKTNETLTWKSLKEEINLCEKNKSFGIIMRNLFNVLVDPNPKIKISWPVLFQNPTLNVDLSITRNSKYLDVWEIDRKKDKNINLEWAKSFWNKEQAEEEEKDQSYKVREEDKETKIDSDGEEEKTQPRIVNPIRKDIDDDDCEIMNK